MKHVRTIHGSAFVAALLALPPVGLGQIPDGYEIIVLADDLGIHSVPEINNLGEVVWSSSFPPSHSEIFWYRDGVVVRVDSPLPYNINPVVNDCGAVVFAAGDDWNPPFDLILWNQGPILTLPDQQPEASTLALNNQGVLVWSFDFSEDFSHVELFRINGGSPEQITDNGVSNASPRMNAGGDLAWVRYNFFQSPWISTVMLRMLNGMVLEITDGSNQPQGVDVNDSGQVVFRQYNGTEDEIRLWQNGATIALSPGTGPRINSAGDVCFGRWYPEDGIRYQMLLRQGSLYRLPSRLGWWNAGSDINDSREVAWRELDHSFGDTRIMLLRRIRHPGDLNEDCQIDLFDMLLFGACVTGPDSSPDGCELPECTLADFDGDGDVDFADYWEFQRRFTGPGMAIDSCIPAK